MKSSGAWRAAASCRRAAYSRAAPESWIEHGPTTASSRSSAPCRMRWIDWRALVTVASAGASTGSSSSSSCGGISARMALMRRSSVRLGTDPGSFAWGPSPVFNGTTFMSFLHGHAALAHPFGQLVEQLDAVRPAQARVGDRHAVVERLAGDEVLAPRIDVAFDHHAHYAALARRELPRDVAAHLEL